MFVRGATLAGAQLTNSAVYQGATSTLAMDFISLHLISFHLTQSHFTAHSGDVGISPSGSVGAAGFCSPGSFVSLMSQQELLDVPENSEWWFLPRSL